MLRPWRLRALHKRCSFETPPDPIPESEITDTVETEVVIIGAGTVGLVCANSTMERDCDSGEMTNHFDQAGG